MGDDRFIIDAYKVCLLDNLVDTAVVEVVDYAVNETKPGTAIFGDWQNWTLEDFKICYNRNYFGMSRGQVSEDRENDGSRFYRAVYASEFSLDDVFPTRAELNPSKWSGFNEQDFLDYSEKHFPGMTMGQIHKDKENEGDIFYRAVRKRGFSSGMFKKVKRVRWSKFSLDEFKNHYDTYYPGMTRLEVENDLENGGNNFYQAVKRRSLLNEIFPKSKIIDWISYSDEDLKKFYESNFKGMKRSAIREDDEGLGRKFYDTVKRRGIQDKIFPPSERCDWTEFTVQDFKDYYDENFDGMGRSQVKRDVEGSGSRFYKAVSKRGFRDEVFPEKLLRRDYWTKEKTLEIARELDAKYDGIPVSRRYKELGISTTFGIAVGKHFEGMRKLRAMLALEKKNSSERELLESLVGDLSNG